MLPLNGCSFEGSRPSGITRSTASAPVNSTMARVVSKWVLFRTTRPGRPRTLNRIFSAAALMGRDDVAEQEQLLDRLEEGEPRGRACVALVAVLDGGPLIA